MGHPTKTRVDPVHGCSTGPLCGPGIRAPFFTRFPVSRALLKQTSREGLYKNRRGPRKLVGLRPFVYVTSTAKRSPRTRRAWSATGRKWSRTAEAAPASSVGSSWSVGRQKTFFCFQPVSERLRFVADNCATDPVRRSATAADRSANEPNHHRSNISRREKKKKNY